MSGDNTASTGALAAHIEDWHPGPQSVTDDVTAAPAAHLAATLDLADRFTVGDPLPLLWHWLYFANWTASAQLGADGHPANGHFMPPIPHRRRMFAGGRVTVHAPLVIGQTARRDAELVSTTIKQGRTGEMLFVTIRHSLTQGNAVALVEERDLVYRSDTGSTTTFAPADATPPTASAPWHAIPQPNSALLFRFSALTSNTHRIHYDERYATGVEGFPGLVVHGPLLAIFMAQLLRTHSLEASVDTFTYRLRKPVFLGDPFVVQGTPQGRTAELSVVSGADDIHASATVTLR